MENENSTIDPKKVKSTLKTNIITQLFIAFVTVALACIYFLMAFPNLDGGALIVITIILLLVELIIVFAACGGIGQTRSLDVPPELKTAKALTVATQTFIVVLSLVISVAFYFVQDYIFFVGYKSGDYSEYTCEDCDDAANGGAWVDKKFGNKYYCQFHYDAHKTALENYKENHFDHDDSDILQIAKDTVKQNLKAPSTATFSSMSETQIKRSGNTWTVSGWVDAQNSFGAMLRSEYTVKITFTSKTKYTIDSCIID